MGILKDLEKIKKAIVRKTKLELMTLELVKLKGISKVKFIDENDQFVIAVTSGECVKEVTYRRGVDIDDEVFESVAREIGAFEVVSEADFDRSYNISKLDNGEVYATDWRELWFWWNIFELKNDGEDCKSPEDLLSKLVSFIDKEGSDWFLIKAKKTKVSEDDLIKIDNPSLGKLKEAQLYLKLSKNINSKFLGEENPQYSKRAKEFNPAEYKEESDLSFMNSIVDSIVSKDCDEFKNMMIKEFTIKIDGLSDCIFPEHVEIREEIFRPYRELIDSSLVNGRNVIHSAIEVAKEFCTKETPVKLVDIFSKSHMFSYSLDVGQSSDYFVDKNILKVSVNTLENQESMTSAAKNISAKLKSKSLTTKVVGGVILGFLAKAVIPNELVDSLVLYVKSFDLYSITSSGSFSIIAASIVAIGQLKGINYIKSIFLNDEELIKKVMDRCKNSEDQYEKNLLAFMKEEGIHA